MTERTPDTRNKQAAGNGLPEIESRTLTTGPLVLRPHGGAWAAIVGLWIPASVSLVVSLLLAKDGYWATAAVFALIGLPLALIPPAYFFRARVALEDRLLVKFGTFRRVGWSAPEAICSITPYTTRWAGSRWSADDFGPLESHGYALRLADGTPIFKLSSTWWSEQGIWQLGRRLGLDGTLEADRSAGMRRSPETLRSSSP